MVSFALHGVGVSGGIAIGRAQLVAHATLEVAHYVIPVGRVEAEIKRFADAVKDVQRELEGLHSAMTGGDVPGEFGAFLDVHWMILTDPTLSEAPKRTIVEQRCNAEWALRRGLITNLLNPKAAVFYVAILPEFVRPEAGSVTSQTLLLSLIYVAIATLIHAVIVTLAGSMQSMIDVASNRRIIRGGFALALVGIAIWFAVATG